MTAPDDDEMTAALTRTLRHHAAEAPSADGFPEKAMALASQRRRRRIHASIAAIVVLTVGIPVAIVATVGSGTPPAAHPTWRWESYRSAQVQVPPDWVYEGPGPGSWCVDNEPRHVPPGVVWRLPELDITATVDCGPKLEYPPAKERGNWLAFKSTGQVGKRTIDGGWVEETRKVNGLFITVFTNDGALRTAILDSAQPIVGADQHGCPTDHPVAADPDGYRPDSANGGLPPADAVESISVCRYELASDSASPLLSSSRIAGEDAKEVVDAIRSAPEGVGPDVQDANPDNPEKNGTGIVVLRVDTADGVREVIVRYAGEVGNGFNDGTTKHQLTADAIRPLLTGPNRPNQMYLPVAMLLSS